MSIKENSSHFKRGFSGNPSGKPKGAVNTTTKFRARIFEAGDEIIDALIEQAKNGMKEAMIFCAERLVPRVRYENMQIEITNKVTFEQREELKVVILQNAANGVISAQDAETFIKLLPGQVEQKEEIDVSKITLEEAEHVYQKVMKGFK